MSEPVLYRKRLIPCECILLKDDCILFQNDSMIVTSWKTLKPKAKLAFGYSCYFLNEGFKVSRFYNAQNQFRFWYCDIIETQYSPESDTYVFLDLLADVILHKDGHPEVLDLDELTEAHQKGLITDEQLHAALNQLQKLLNLIECRRFEQHVLPMMEVLREHHLTI